MKAQSTVDREIGRLNKLVQGDDLLLARIAWEVLYAIRWAREDSKLSAPSNSTKSAANLIRHEIRDGAITGKQPEAI